MQSQVDQISPILVEVKVEVPWSKVNEGLEGAYRTLQRTARVRGFRQGKVPRNVVKNLMGKSVEREVTSRLVEEALAEAVTTHSLEPVAMTNMDAPPAINEGQPFSFSAKLEVKPKIESVDTSSLKVNRDIEVVSDAAVDAEVERARERAAELIAPNPARGAKNGDTVALSIKVTVEGLDRPDLTSEDTRVELGQERLLPELEAGLVGAALDEERAIEVTIPDDYGHDALRGKKAMFGVRIKEMFEKSLPAIDDDFARDLDHESLDAMKAALRKQLEADALKKADAQVREAVVDKLIDANPVPVPPSLVERQAQSMMREIFQLQQMLGRQIPMDESMQTELLGRAERRIRAGLLFGAIAAQEKIEVSPEEIDKRLAEIAEQSGKHIAKVRAEYQGERRDSLSSQLLQNKLLEYLMSRATITDGAPEPEAEAKGKSEAKAEDTSETKASEAKPKAKAKAKEASKEASPVEGEESESKAPKAKAEKPKSPAKKPKKAAEDDE